MNNVEKNLNEIYEKFYYPINLQELFVFLNSKFEAIVNRGKNDGIVMSEEDEKELLHNMFKEGINFFLFSKLKAKLREFEESISSQQMLLAYPHSIENREEVLNVLPSSVISELLKNSLVIFNNPYYDM